MGQREPRAREEAAATLEERSTEYQKMGDSKAALMHTRPAAWK